MCVCVQVLTKGPLAAPGILAAAGRHPPLLRALEARMASKPQLYKVCVCFMQSCIMSRAC